jgi:hypothetical protein
MIIKCKPTRPGKTDCPLLRYCIARMNDPTVTGCGIPLWYGGFISRDQVQVEHTVRDGKDGKDGDGNE